MVNKETKTIARRKVSTAIQRGKLKKRPCEVCGNAKVQAHHVDYTKPLEVKWLCLKCHNAVHGKLVIDEIDTNTLPETDETLYAEIDGKIKRLYTYQDLAIAIGQDPNSKNVINNMRKRKERGTLPIYHTIYRECSLRNKKRRYLTPAQGDEKRRQKRIRILIQLTQM